MFQLSGPLACPVGKKVMFVMEAPGLTRCNPNPTKTSREQRSLQVLIVDVRWGKYIQGGAVGDKNNQQAVVAIAIPGRKMQHWLQGGRERPLYGPI